MTRDQPEVSKYGIKILLKLVNTPMSEIWLAEWDHTNSGQQRMIIKLAQAGDHAFSHTSQQQILNEESWLKRFRSTNFLGSGIINILPITHIREKPIFRAKIFHPKESWFLLLEYLEGGSLNDLLRERPILLTTDTIRIAYHLARTLDYVHQSGCVHLDIKPSNIMFRHKSGKQTETEPVLIDFGISQASGEKHYVTGAEGWLAPEVLVAKNAKKMITIHPSMDIFSFGLLINFMLTGQHPRDESLDKSNIIPTPILKLVSAMTAIDPYQRPSASEVVAQLSEFYAHLAPGSIKGTLKNGLFDFFKV